VTFQAHALRFHVVARDRIRFPRAVPANILRGAFGSALREIACAPECPGFQGASARECELRGSCEYARIFEPGEPSGQRGGPSGLEDRPRPFVFRAAHLDGRAIEPGEPFWFGVNLFDMRGPIAETFARVFEKLACQGLGPGRVRASLERVEALECAPISLSPARADVTKLQVGFVTPTELKSGSEIVSAPEFPVLFARARDRVSTLRALYGAGPLDIDFRALGERAHDLRMTRCELERVDAQRRSSRTGQVHSIGGFTGVAEYEGQLAAFLPFLEAARFTGVGRHCVWGKGEIDPRVILNS
jgi:hypothetical protein